MVMVLIGKMRLPVDFVVCHVQANGTWQNYCGFGNKWNRQKSFEMAAGKVMFLVDNGQFGFTSNIQQSIMARDSQSDSPTFSDNVPLQCSCLHPRLG